MWRINLILCLSLAAAGSWAADAEQLEQSVVRVIVKKASGGISSGSGAVVARAMC